MDYSFGGKLNTQNAFDLTLTPTCGQTPTMSNCGYFWMQIFFFGSSPLSALTILDADESTDQLNGCGFKEISMAVFFQSELS